MSSALIIMKRLLCLLPLFWFLFVECETTEPLNVPEGNELAPVPTPELTVTILSDHSSDTISLPLVLNLSIAKLEQDSSLIIERLLDGVAHGILENNRLDSIITLDIGDHELEYRFYFEALDTLISSGKINLYNLGIKYSLTVEQGQGSGQYFAFDTVAIIANDPIEGIEFVSWTGDVDHVLDTTTQTS